MTSVLKLGDRGDAVKTLQSRLNNLLNISPPLVVDGDFGNKTDSAVKRYQAMYGLTIDGIVGRKTWAKLISAAPPLPHQRRSTHVFNSAPWMNVANQEMGQKEIRGRDHNPRIVAYHSTTSLRANDDETPWCASFVNWCLKQKNIRGTNSAAAASWVNWGRPSGAKAGAIAVIYNHAAANSNLTRSGNHVAFLVQETHTHFKLLGGNQSDQVKISSYPKSKWRLKAYRWPA